MRKRDWIFMISISVFYVVGITSLVLNQAKDNPTTSAPTTKQVAHAWTKTDSLAYAHDQVIKDAQAQFVCLSNLWGKESAWNPKAVNPVKVMGKHAGGIAQILGMSPLTPPTLQIERGLSYIYFRFGTACKAWQHFQRLGWY